MTTIAPLTSTVLASGKYAIDFMLEHGLKPEHAVLDLGCCVLRLGIPLIQYLNKNLYYGFDKEPEAIKIAHQEITKRKLEHKEPTVWHTPDINLDRVDKLINYAIAYSVFNHMDREHIETCFKNLTEKAAPGCKLFATNCIADGPDIVYGSIGTVRTAVKEYTKVKYPRTIIDKMASDFGWSTTLFDKFNTFGSSHRMFLFEKM